MTMCPVRPHTIFEVRCPQVGVLIAWGFLARNRSIHRQHRRSGARASAETRRVMSSLLRSIERHHMHVINSMEVGRRPEPVLKRKVFQGKT